MLPSTMATIVPRSSEICAICSAVNCADRNPSVRSSSGKLVIKLADWIRSIWAYSAGFARRYSITDIGSNAGVFDSSSLGAGFVDIFLEFVFSDAQKVGARFFNDHALTGAIFDCSSCAGSYSFTVIKFDRQIIRRGIFLYIGSLLDNRSKNVDRLNANMAER